jgi:hypothetical protein
MAKLEKKYRDRLLKLAKHLEGRRLGHKKFDFTIFSEGKLNRAGTCGTSGCAIGECPTLFPRDWRMTVEVDINGKRTSSGPELRRSKDQYGYRLGNFNAAEKYFGLSENDARVLFQPADTFDDLLIPPGIRRLGDRAKPKSVAKNIRNYVKYREDW